MFDGMFLGMMSFVGMSVIYQRLPGKMQIFAQQHPLFTDVVLAVFFYEVFGLTITAHFAVVMQSLVVSAALHVAAHKQDFQFLYDAADVVKSKIAAIMQQIKTHCVELNAANRAAKLNAQALSLEC